MRPGYSTVKNKAIFYSCTIRIGVPLTWALGLSELLFYSMSLALNLISDDDTEP